MSKLKKYACASIGHPSLMVSIWFCQHEGAWHFSQAGGTTDEPGEWTRTEFGPFATAADVWGFLHSSWHDFSDRVEESTETY